MKRKQNIIILLAILFTSNLSCKKLLEVEPPIEKIVQAKIFDSDNSAITAVLGMYELMSQTFGAGQKSVALNTGLSSDELVSLQPQDQPLYENQMYAMLMDETTNWSIYNLIYNANAALEGIEASRKLSPAITRQLTGEVRFLRALGYFYLVNEFGDVPLITATDYTISKRLPRESIQNVYGFIEKELLAAKELISANYVAANSISPSTAKLRANKSVISALLARVYIYTGQYQKAIDESTSLINGSEYSLLGSENIDKVFLKESKEAIWQLQSAISYNDTYEGFTFILNETPGEFTNRPYYLNSSLVELFDNNDLRLKNWIGKFDDNSTIPATTYFFAYKYKVRLTEGTTPPKEDVMIFRLAEQYLIRSEAYLKLGQHSNALSDLNAIRNRAGLDSFESTDPNIVLNVIVKERARELFLEGHRWFDLKRLGIVDKVMSIEVPRKSANLSWKSDQQLYPLPLNDIRANLNLKQNPGYSE
jgi:hypothetical protein